MNVERYTMRGDELWSSVNGEWVRLDDLLNALWSDLGNLDPAIHGEDLGAASRHARDDLDIIRTALRGLVVELDELRMKVVASEDEARELIVQLAELHDVAQSRRWGNGAARREFRRILGDSSPASVQQTSTLEAGSRSFTATGPEHYCIGPDCPECPPAKERP